MKPQWEEKTRYQFASKKPDKEQGLPKKTWVSVLEWNPVQRVVE